MATSLVLKLLVQNAGFQKELVQSQKDFNKFTKNLLGDAKGFKRIGAELKGFGTSAVIAVTVPLLAASTGFLKVASDFESAFTGVRKTVNATEAEFKILEDGIRKMALEIPASTEAIARVAEAAGQLGISKENILEFTRTMIDLGNTTNISAEEAAQSLARFVNITQLSENEISNLASTVVELGNNLATTEQEIVAMSLRMAAAAKIVGFLESDTLALAATMSSVGIEAEAGGTAMSKVMIKLAQVIKVPGVELDRFAKISGQTAKEFQKSFKDDAAKAMVTFIEGLNKVSKAGGDVFTVMDEMGLAEARVRRALLSAASAGDLLRTSIDLGREAWAKNTALTIEAELRYKTFEKQLVLVRNKLNDIGITVGKELIPIFLDFLNNSIVPLIDRIVDLAKWFKGLDDDTKTYITTVGLLVAAAGPLLIALGLMISSLQTLIPMFAIGGTLSLGLAATISAVKALSIAALGPAGVVVGLVAMTVWALKASGQWTKLTTSIKETNSVLLKNIERFGIMKTSLALVLNFLNLNAFGYEHYLDLLSDPKGKEGIDSVSKSMNENAEAAKDMFFVSKSGAEAAGKAINQMEIDVIGLIDAEKGYQAILGQSILDEAQRERKRELQAQAEANRQEFLGRIIQNRAAEELRAEISLAAKKGEIQEQLGRDIVRAELKKREAYITSDDLIRVAAEGTATAIKALWNDTSVTAEDAFKNAANVFVDVMAQMLVEAIITGKAIQIQMAAATAGISLVVGLIASVFGGSKKSSGPTELEKATKSFLQEIQRTLETFEEKILTVLQKVRRGTALSTELLADFFDQTKLLNALGYLGTTFGSNNTFSTERNSDLARIIREQTPSSIFTPRRYNPRLLLIADKARSDLQQKILKNAKDLIPLVERRYEIEKAAINEIIGILQRQKDFKKDIDNSIVGVQRAFLSQRELFSALNADARKIETSIRRDRILDRGNPEENIQILKNLEQIYLQIFDVGKDVFEGLPRSLQALQKLTIRRLKDVKDFSEKPFQSLINVQLEILGIEKNKIVTQRNMEQELKIIGQAAIQTIKILQEIGNQSGANITTSQIRRLLNSLSRLGLADRATQFADGGIVTKPTFAMIGEGGESEAIIPLSKAKQFGFSANNVGATVNNFSFSFPNIKDFRDITVPEAEQMLTGTFNRAMTNLNRTGYKLPIGTTV